MGKPSITEVAFDSTSIDNHQSAWINAKWEIPGEAKAPVKIVLPLPDALKGNADKFPMTDGEDVIGECVVTATEITCSVDDSFVNENPMKVKGGIKFQVTVDLAEGTEGERTFEFGDLKTTVTVKPAGGTPCVENCDMGPVTHSKWGHYNKADDTIEWWVQVAAPAPGIMAGQQIRIWDELDTDLYTLVGQPKLYSAVSLIRDPNTGQQYGNYVEDKDTAVTVSNGGLELGFTSLPGKGTSFHGPDRDEVGIDGRFYQVVWTVKVNDLGKAGTYTNTAGYEIGSEKTTGITGETKRQSGSAWGIGTNFGAFEVTKKIDAASTDQLAQLPEFQVRYSAVNAEGVTTTDSFTVAADGSFESPEFFNGTTVTIEEILPTNTSAIEWQKPVFTVKEGPGVSIVDGKLTLQFTKANKNLGKLTQVILTNSAELQTGSFSASKKIVNPDGLVISPKTSFLLHYSYPANPELGFIGGAGTLELPSSGDIVTSQKLPVGAVLEFTEEIVKGEETVGGTWQQDKTVLPAPLTITDSTSPVEVELVNTIARDTGGFTLTKVIAGNGAGHIGDAEEFTVKYSYPADDTLGFPAGAGTVKVSAGAPAVSPQIPFGAQVTLEEGDASRPGLDHSYKFSKDTFTIDGQSSVDVTLTNTYTLQAGSIELRKLVEGDGANLLTAGTAFAVDYSYPAGIGFEAANGSVEVPADGTVATIKDIPYGAVVTLTERAPAAVPGATWGAASFAGVGTTGETIEVTVDGTTAHKVTLTNTLTRDLGAFSVSKTVTGSGTGLLEDGIAFDFEYSYPAGPGFEAQSGTVTVPADGTAVAVKDVPAGAEVTLVERQPAVAGGTWSQPVYSDSNTFSVETGATVEVKVLNEITLNTGTFQLQKKVAGTGASLVPKETEFTVDYSYPANTKLGYEAGTGSVTVLADGTAVTSEEIPYGAEVTLTERAPAAVPGATWATPKFSLGAGKPDETVSFTVGGADPVEVELTNTITTVPVVSPGPTETPSKNGVGGDKLSATGAQLMPLFLGGGAALLLGAALVLVVRSRRNA